MEACVFDLLLATWDVLDSYPSGALNIGVCLFIWYMGSKFRDLGGGGECWRVIGKLPSDNVYYNSCL